MSSIEGLRSLTLDKVPVDVQLENVSKKKYPDIKKNEPKIISNEKIKQNSICFSKKNL